MIQPIENTFILHYRVWGNEFTFHADNMQAILWYANCAELHELRWRRTMSQYFAETKIAPKQYCEQAKEVTQNIVIRRDFAQESRKYVRPWWVVIDCWANQWWTSLVYAAQVGKTGKVISIEGDKWNSEQIQKNADLNGYDHVQSVHAACSDESGKTISFTGEHVWDTNNSSLVTTVCLDDFADQNPTFIKIDVEWFELHVLHWAINTLTKVRPSIEIELHNPEMLWQYGTTRKQVVDFLLNHGYTVTPWRSKEYALEDLDSELKDEQVWLLCEPVPSFRLSKMTKPHLNVIPKKPKQSIPKPAW